MKGNKPNISLANLAELKSSGLFIALRKGFNEVFRTKRRRLSFPLTPAKNDYEELISVIICTAGRPKDAAKAAESIARQGFDGRYEIIIVNNSNAPYNEVLPKGTRVVSEPVLGLSRARNRGMTAANGDILLYIDDDARAELGLLSAMRSAFNSHPQAAIIGGQIYLNLPNPVPDVFLEGRESVWSGYTVSYTEFREVTEQYEFPYGACFAVRHNALEALGGFPLGYGRCGSDYAGGEEIALCFAARRAGLKIGIEPQAAVLHLVSKDRFTKEHIRRTIYEGISTTQRLFSEGYSSTGWSPEYINERICIIESEIRRLKKHKKELAAFYKQCELDAFKDILLTHQTK